MRKFENYPIFVNHPGRWEEVRQSQLEYFKNQRDRHMVSWLTYTGKRLYEIMEDQNPTYENRMFEHDVYRALRLISSTRVGKLLFDALAPGQNYWIVPLDSIDKATCDCGGAYTFPGQPKEGGGIRVYIDVKGLNPVTKKWVGLDDVLFHEMVHAYRMGSVGYEVVNAAKPMQTNGNAEEFLALQMQNVYLSNRRASRFYLSYGSLKSVSKGTAYNNYANDPEVLRAFRYWVETEPLAAEVARWMNPADSFNPFRDYAILERINIRGKGITRLPAF